MISSILSILGHAFLGFLFGAAVCGAIYYQQHKKHRQGDFNFMHGYLLTIIPFSIILGLLAGLSWWALLLIAVIITHIGLMMVILDHEYYVKHAQAFANDIL